MRVAACIASLLLLFGCHSSQPRYYTLDGTPSEIAASQRLEYLTVLQVALPAYLDRPHLVVRDKANRLHVSEHHQWAGRLRENIGRVLAHALSRRLEHASVLAAPLPTGIQGTRTLAIDIQRFERMPDGEVRLDAQWHLLEHNRRLCSYQLALRSSKVVAFDDYAGIAGQMSGLLEQMAKQIASQSCMIRAYMH